MLTRLGLLLVVTGLTACDTGTLPPQEPPLGLVCEHEPLPAPSGEEGRLLFMSRRDGFPRLYSSRPDGSDVQLHTPWDLAVGFGQWSPDRSEILVGVDSLPIWAGPPTLYIAPAEGGTRDDLRPLYLRPRVWHSDPDSVYGVDGLAFRTLRGFRAAWSPDGQRVAVDTCTGFEPACSHVLTVVDLVRDTVHVVRDPLGRRLSRLVWHPTKRRIGFQIRHRASGPDAYQILGLRLNTGAVDSLTARTDSVSGLLAPDWTRVAAYQDEQHGIWDLGCQSFEPYALDTQERIIPYAWSPDGSRYAGIRIDDSDRALYVVDPRAGMARRLFPEDETIGSVDWR